MIDHVWYLWQSPHLEEILKETKDEIRVSEGAFGKLKQKRRSRIDGHSWKKKKKNPTPWVMVVGWCLEEEKSGPPVRQVQKSGATNDQSAKKMVVQAQSWGGGPNLMLKKKVFSQGETRKKRRGPGI